MRRNDKTGEILSGVERFVNFFEIFFGIVENSFQLARKLLLKKVAFQLKIILAPYCALEQISFLFLMC